MKVYVAVLWQGVDDGEHVLGISLSPEIAKAKAEGVLKLYNDKYKNCKVSLKDIDIKEYKIDEFSYYEIPF